MQFLRLYNLEEEPVNTRYFTKACQLYRDKLKQMAELNEVFIFNKDCHQDLPVEEGKISIFGTNPNAIFSGAEGSGNDPNLFKRDTYKSNGRSRSMNGISSNKINSPNPNSQGINFNQETQDTEGISRMAGTFIEKTKENMSFIGQKLGVFQEYLAQQFQMANCCNNFKFNED